MPVERSSITRTRAPLANQGGGDVRSNKAGATGNQSNTRQRHNLASYSHVFKTHFSHVRWIIDIP